MVWESVQPSTIPVTRSPKRRRISSRVFGPPWSSDGIVQQRRNGLILISAVFNDERRDGEKV